MLHNLQAEIARKKVPQAEIAKAISVSDRTIRKKMTGETKFTFPEARKIRDTFFSRYGTRLSIQRGLGR